MTTLLFFQTLLQRLHQLIPATQRFDLCFFFFCQQAFGKLFQPFFRNVSRQHGVERFHAFEVGCKGAVKAVKVGLVFYQTYTRQMIKIIHTAVDHALLHRLAQHQVFLYGYRQAVLLQRKKEINQHKYVERFLVRRSWVFCLERRANARVSISTVSFRQKYQLFKQMYVLLVFQQRAIHRRDKLVGIA